MRKYKGKIYIAGPMRDYKDFNFPAFDRADRLGTKLGWKVINPANMDRNDPKSINKLSSELRQRKYAKRDVAAIFNCKAIALLPNWHKSTGARAEYWLARWLMLEILDARTFKMNPKYILK